MNPYLSIKMNDNSLHWYWDEWWLLTLVLRWMMTPTLVLRCMMTTYLGIEMNDDNPSDPHRDDCSTDSQYIPSPHATQFLERWQPDHLTLWPWLRILIMMRTIWLCQLDVWLVAGQEVAGLEDAGMCWMAVVAIAWNIEVQIQSMLSTWSLVPWFISRV